MNAIPGDDALPWSILHDGQIADVTSADGCILVVVACEYLRERFAESGRGFLLELQDCDRVEYRPFDAEPITDLHVIAGSNLSIYAGEAAADGVKVVATCGELNLRYSAMTIRLDTGRIVPLEELRMHAECYWDELGQSDVE